MLLVVAIVRVVGIGWGLPASDGWDVDGIAPRDFLPGLVETFTPGHYFTYPPFHLALLALLTLPMTLVGLARAPSMAPADLLPAFLSDGIMTSFALAARATNLVMSLGVVLVMGKLSESAFGTRRARVWAMAFAGTEAAATYYAHTTNLDMPMLFWGSLAILAFVRAVEASAGRAPGSLLALRSISSGAGLAAGPNYLRRAAIFAAFAIASKDQGYALFAIAVPVGVVIWLYGVKGGRAVNWAAGGWGGTFAGESGEVVEKRFVASGESADKRLSGSGEAAKATFAGESGGSGDTRATELNEGVSARRLAWAAGICIGLVLLIDGALFNPSGFAARLRFLTGPASQDFAQHARTWAGRASALEDTILFLPHHYPLIAAPVFLIGIWLALRSKRGAAQLVAMMPLLVIVSFTLAFNCVARRVEERFVMPQMQFLAVYAGVIGVVAHRWVRFAGGAVVVWALRDAATIDANMLGDARYAAEDYMRAHFGGGERVETYGSNVYLPRFPEAAAVSRVGVTKGKNPMPGVTEVEGRLGDVDARAPLWIVVPQGFAWRYLQADHAPDAEGRVLPAIQRSHLQDADSTEFVRSLFAEKLDYRLAAHFHYAGSSLFPPRPLHASLATDVYIFERR